MFCVLASQELQLWMFSTGYLEGGGDNCFHIARNCLVYKLKRFSMILFKKLWQMEYMISCHFALFHKKYIGAISQCINKNSYNNH